MCRSLISLFVAFALTVFGMPAQAQFATAQDSASAQYPPPQYQQPQYPPAQQYPQTQQGYSNNPQSYAQPDQGQGEPAPDPAMDQRHAVARLSIVQGDVNVKLGSTGELVAGAMNAPLVAQDHLQTSPGSRAEVELDAANLIRLGPNTDLGFADLEYHRYQVQLGAGTIIYRVLRDSNAQSEIDTPSIAIRPQQRGEYRISVLDDGTTQITVRSGAAEMLSPRGSQQLQAGQTTLVRGNPSDPEFQTNNEIARDQLDDWSAGRDRDLLASQSYNYVNSDVYGADDLDQYGRWVPSQYGQVWAPQPPTPEWSPYSYGQWSWVDYYGWTWVDYAPWGWAPYHYGRWFFNGSYGWCWWPGARFGLSLWSPALVGFFGWGGGVGVWAGLGWVALAPFEVFHGWWGHGLFFRGGFGFRGGYGFGRGYAFARSANIASMYRNASFRGGAMTAAFGRFGGPGQRFSPATRTQLTNASSFRGGVPVSPARGAMGFANRAAVANPRLASASNRQFFRAGQSFGAGRSNAQQFASEHGVAPNLERSAGARAGYAPQSSSGGWQRFGAPGATGGFRQGINNAQEHSGWHSFGAPQGSNSGAYGGARQQTTPPGTGGYSGANNGGRSAFTGPRYSAPGYRAPESRGYNAPAQRYNQPAPHYEAPAAPRYSAPAAPRYSAPAAPHYSAPSTPHNSEPRSSAPRGGGESHGGGGGSSHGGGGSRGGGGGGHSSSGGHHGR